jgi:hypothetical protein
MSLSITAIARANFIAQEEHIDTLKSYAKYIDTLIKKSEEHNGASNTINCAQLIAEDTLRTAKRLDSPHAFKAMVTIALKTMETADATHSSLYAEPFLTSILSSDPSITISQQLRILCAKAVCNTDSNWSSLLNKVEDALQNNHKKTT